MKTKDRIPAAAALPLSLVLAAGSRTFLAPCSHEDGSLAACAGAGPMLMAAGILLAAFSVCALCTRERAARAAYYTAMLPAALIGFLTPGTLAPLCRMSTMRCQAVTRPAGMLLCGLVLLCAAAGLLLGRRKRGGVRP